VRALKKGALPYGMVPLMIKAMVEASNDTAPGNRQPGRRGAPASLMCSVGDSLVFATKNTAQKVPVQRQVEQQLAYAAE
jgi:hypothetical protein